MTSKLSMRNRHLLALDVEWAKATYRKETGETFHAAFSEVTGKWMTTDEVALMSMHLARQEIPEMPDTAKAESRKWLTDRGLLPSLHAMQAIR